MNLKTIEEALKNSVTYLPLELSSFLGGFIEEVIAPIPSPFVMAAVGSAAYAQSKGLLSLLVLGLTGAIGKTLGAWIVYIIADKLEDVVVGKLGRFLGVSHKEIESIGKHFKGNWKDGLMLFVLRVLPIVPSSPISVVSGIIKIDLPTYLTATFAGNFFRNLIYIYLGYAGVSAYQSVLSGMDNMESVVQIVIFFSLLALVGWIYYKRFQKEKKN